MGAEMCILLYYYSCRHYIILYYFTTLPWYFALLYYVATYMGAEVCTVVIHAVNTLTLSTENSTNVLSFCNHSTQGHAVKL